MQSFDWPLLIGGFVVFLSGIWMFRRLRPAATNRPRWVQSEFGANVIVFALLSVWATGIILIGYGLGLGQTF